MRIEGVDVLLWNPRVPAPMRPRRLFRWTKNTPFGPRINNFGDLIGPMVVRQLLEERGLGPQRRKMPHAELGVVGSVVHMLPDGATVWGAGVNGKHLELSLPRNLEFAAVRGPLTGSYLAERGLTDPGIYGDPALLLDYSVFCGDWSAEPAIDVLHISNMNEPWAPARTTASLTQVSPRSPFVRVVRMISRSSLVVGSSLHAIVVAEALGVPARAIASRVEPPFKYLDYYEGTGRSNVRIAGSIHEALNLGGVSQPQIMASALRASFPDQLWPKR